MAIRCNSRIYADSARPRVVPPPRVLDHRSASSGSGAAESSPALAPRVCGIGPVIENGQPRDTRFARTTAQPAHPRAGSVGFFTGACLAWVVSAEADNPARLAIGAAIHGHPGRAG